MFAQKTLLALSVSCCVSLAYAANQSQFNYDPSVSSQDMGVNINELLDCGADYGTKGCRSNNTDNTGTTQSGYQKNTEVRTAVKTAKEAEKEENIVTDSDRDILSRNGIKDLNGPPKDLKYNNLRDIQEQKSVLDGVLNEWSGTDVSDLKNTYNTRALPTEQGNAVKQKCMSYTDVELNRMLDSQDVEKKSLANHCLAVRTVANTNDKALESRLHNTDSLRSGMTKRTKLNNTTNTEVTNINTKEGNPTKANSMSYACDLTSLNSIVSGKTCYSKAFGRQQTCTQVVDIQCGDTAQGTRDLPECGLGGIDKNSFTIRSTRPSHNFKLSESGFSFSERWQEQYGRPSLSVWTIGFNIKNLNKAEMVLHDFSYDNKITIRLNGAIVASAQTNSNNSLMPKTNLAPYLRKGENTFEVRLENYGGPAWAAVNVIIDPSSFGGCMCKESWKTVCTDSKVEL